MKHLLAATLERDWFGQMVAGSPAISLALDQGELRLAASRQAPAELLADEVPGAFREGLWARDCAEAFLLNPRSGYYLEINLSPSGSWWACAFSAPLWRLTPQGLELKEVRSAGRIAADSWSAEWRIPLAQLPPELEFAANSTCANLTFCLGLVPQRFLSLHPLGNGIPDFHRPAAWPRFAN
ncbi:MAG: hypothetical protein RL095_4116 [Verrucomicrobiota bacterium]|jgi:hypothetical protein